MATIQPIPDADGRITLLMTSIGLFVGLATYYVFPMAVGKHVRLLSTMLHEVGHACAVWLTKGKTTDLVVRFDGSGECRFKGGALSLILAAGHLAPVFAAALLVCMATIGRPIVGIAPILLAALACVLIGSQRTTRVIATATLLILLPMSIWADRNGLSLISVIVSAWLWLESHEHLVAAYRVNGGDAKQDVVRLAAIHKVNPRFVILSIYALGCGFGMLLWIVLRQTTS